MEGFYPPAQTQEQTEQLPVVTVNLTRRYACDRCRIHKLRCNRDLMTTTNAPCQRCRKARAKCTIGSSVRLGGAAAERLQNQNATHEEDMQAPPLTTGPISRDNVRTLMQSEHARNPHGSIIAIESPHQLSHQSHAPMFDSTHLSPVPWLDMISFDGGQGLDFETSAPALPTPPYTDRTQVFHAPAHTFGISTTSTTARQDMPLLNHVPGTGTASADAPTVSRNLDPHSQLSLTAPETSREQSFDPYTPIVLDTVSGNGTTATSSLPRVGSSVRSTSSSAELKNACIQQLSDLSASLMKDLDLIITCKTASSFLFTPSDKAATGYILQTLDGTTSQENAIGRMLHGSEKFLDIIKLFKQLSLKSSPAASDSSPRPSEPGQAPNNSSSPGSTIESQPRMQGPEDRASERWSLFQAYIAATATSQGSAGSTPEHNSPSFVEEQKLNVPSTLVILSCYSSLLKIYETVFSVIHHVLECSPSTASTTELPPTLRGLSINGFGLESHRSLQIRILIQVSTYMLDSIQKAVEDDSSNSMLPMLLRTVMKEEGRSTSLGEETGMKGVRDLLRQIETMVQ
ncbi:Phomacin cluster regulator phmR [Cladobotryum mycophilum]|uniref:Phomacin cluster regulator phmR n=1 Tax=Cladobotryum mycophilum TaxID=491253 RepID=A0ABR0SWA1_9HYPO